MNWRLSKLFDGRPLRRLAGEGDPWVREITVDPEEVAPGVLFLARSNYYGDGHKRLKEVVERGACAVVVSAPQAANDLGTTPLFLAPEEDPLQGQLAARFYEHPTRALKVFGITGTNGKTSTAWILEHLLRAAGEQPALMGTLAYRFGERSLEAVNTTPDALFVQRFARQVVDAGATALVMEVSSHALALGRVAEVDFDVVGFTNLSHDHLDFHGSVENYAAAKRALFEKYLQGAPDRRAVAVAGPGEVWREMLEAAPAQTQRVAVHLGEGTGGLRLKTLRRAPTGCEIEARWPNGRARGWLPLLGTHNVANAGLALAMSCSMESRRFADHFEALGRCAPIPGRLEEVIPPGEHPGVWVDYAHTPAAVEKATKVIAELVSPPWVVLGCGGDRDRTKRRPMADAALRNGKALVATSDNPRSESPEEILAEMLQGIPFGPTLQKRLRREEAIDWALRQADAPVLVAGKGHETTQEVAGTKWRFDDREIARRAFLAWRGGRPLDAQPYLSGLSPSRLMRILGGRPLPTSAWGWTDAAWLLPGVPEHGWQLNREGGETLRCAPQREGELLHQVVEDPAHAALRLIKALLDIATRSAGKRAFVAVKSQGHALAERLVERAAGRCLGPLMEPLDLTALAPCHQLIFSEFDERELGCVPDARLDQYGLYVDGAQTRADTLLNLDLEEILHLIPTRPTTVRTRSAVVPRRNHFNED